MCAYAHESRSQGPLGMAFRDTVSGLTWALGTELQSPARAAPEAYIKNKQQTRNCSKVLVMGFFAHQMESIKMVSLTDRTRWNPGGWVRFPGSRIQTDTL